MTDELAEVKAALAQYDTADPKHVLVERRDMELVLTPRVENWLHSLVARCEEAARVIDCRNRLAEMTATRDALVARVEQAEKTLADYDQCWACDGRGYSLDEDGGAAGVCPDCEGEGLALVAAYRQRVANKAEVARDLQETLWAELGVRDHLADLVDALVELWLAERRKVDEVFRAGYRAAERDTYQNSGGVDVNAEADAISRWKEQGR